MASDMTSSKKEYISRHERYFRFFVLAVVLVLLALAIHHIWQKQQTRNHILGELVGVMQEIRQKGYVVAAVQEVQNWSDEDFWYAWPYLNDQSIKLEPLFYYEFARRFWQADNQEEALFWAFLGRFRLLYDVHRCEHRENANLWRGYWENVFLPSDIMAEAFNPDNQNLETILQKLLAWKSLESVMGETSPVYLCAFVKQPRLSVSLVPTNQWPLIYRKLQLVTKQRSLAE